jgi:hypothetical protein
MSEKKEVLKVVKTQSFKVLKEITVDRLYGVGETIELSDRTTIEALITNKIIK